MAKTNDKKKQKNETAIAKREPEPTTALAKGGNFVSDDEAASQTQGGGGFEFLKLVQPQTKALDSVAGLKVGDYLLGASTNLGGEIKNMVAVASRSRAVLFDRDKGEVALESFDAGSPEYAEIRAKGGDYGLEFLYWIPDAGKFAAFHYGKKTTRNIGAQAQQAAKSKAVVSFKSHVVSNKKGRFAVIDFEAGAADDEIDEPSPEMLKAALASFNAVKLEKSAQTTGREH